MVALPDRFKDPFLDDTPAFAFLATVMKDGSPQVTPVCFDVEDGLIRVNTAESRTKWRNMRRRNRVALAIVDPKDPYRYVQIRGRVERWTTEGARRHIDRLAGKYDGRATFDGPADEQRVVFFVVPESVSGQG